MRDLAAAWLRSHPATASAVVDMTDRVGAGRTSDRILRVTADAAVARLPRPGHRRTRRVAMYRVAGRDQSALALESDWRRFEEPMPTVFWELCCLASGHVVDVGANTGIYALMALAADKRRFVTAFEPVPAVRKMLTANVLLGHYEGRACLSGDAVGAEPGLATLFVPPSMPGDYIETSASLSADFKDMTGEEIPVRVTTLDAWWAASRQPTVDLVKIDVESREYDVLRGAGELSAAQQPIFFYELLPQGDAAGIGAWADARGLVDVRLRSRCAIVGDQPAFDPEAWNHMLVPSARLPVVVRVLRDCGLVVVD